MGEITTLEAAQNAALAVELAEAETCWSQHRCATEVTKARLGLHCERLAGGVLLVTRKSRNLYFNRLVGAGLVSPLTEEQVTQVVAAAQARGASGLAVMVPNLAEKACLEGRLRTAGFKAGEPSGKLWRDNSRLAPASRSPFSLRRVRARDADLWVDVVAQVWRTFGSRRDWYTARVAAVASGWTHYLAWDGAEPVGAAAMSVQRVRLPNTGWVRVGHLVDGVTLRDARKRGVQTALIRRRIRDGLAQGCRWFTSETAPPLPRRPLVSYRNLVRQGFSLCCLRDSWSVRWK